MALLLLSGHSQIVDFVFEDQAKEFPLLTFFFLVFLPFLGPHPWHMEVPRLGIESELKLPAYTTATATHGIRATSATYTTAHGKGNAGSLIH